jgi:hypothetical protein
MALPSGRGTDEEDMVDNIREHQIGFEKELQTPPI